MSDERYRIELSRNYIHSLGRASFKSLTRFSIHELSRLGKREGFSGLPRRPALWSPLLSSAGLPHRERRLNTSCYATSRSQHLTSRLCHAMSRSRHAMAWSRHATSVTDPLHAIVTLIKAPLTLCAANIRLRTIRSNVGMRVPTGFQELANPLLEP
jgi:hypothetical protein